MKPREIDERIYALYDEYCHSAMSRREFLGKASMLGVASASGLAMAQALLPDYARAQTVSFTDERIKPLYVEYDSPGGSSGRMRGYLVQPVQGQGPYPAVLVIHENRGLNPYIEDVARRLATQGFLALAPDGLFPIGGYPGNDDDGKAMQRSLDPARLFTDLHNSARFLQAHALSSGRLGATGFCFGGGVVNQLAVTMGAGLAAGAPFYGRAPASEDVPRIEAALMIHYAEDDPRVNAARAGYEKALQANGKTYVMYDYPGTHHGFHNLSTPRYDETQAELAWARTIGFFKARLA